MTEPSLADLVSKLSAPAAQSTDRVDPMTMMMAFMQQQQAMSEARMREEREARREAEERRREERAESQRMLMGLATTVLPKLLEKPAIDPFVLKLLDSSTNKDQLKDFLAASSQLNAQSQQMMMQQLATMFGTMGEMQSRMTERQMEMMETRLEKIAEGSGGDDKDEDNGIAGIIKAALPHLLGAKAPIAQAVVDAAQANPPAPVAAPMPAPAPRPAPVRPVALDSITDPVLRRKVHLLQVVMVLHQRPVEWDKRPAFVRTALHLITKSDDIARAIMTDDQGALIGALAPAVQVDPVLGAWIGAPATQGWLASFIGDTLKPALASIAAEIRARQERMAQQEPERIAAPEPASIPMRPAQLMPQHAPPAPVEPETLGPGDVAGDVAGE